MGLRNFFILFFSAMAVSLVLLVVFFSLFIKNFDGLTFNAKLPEGAPNPIQSLSGKGSTPEQFRADGVYRSNVNVPTDTHPASPTDASGSGKRTGTTNPEEDSPGPSIGIGAGADTYPLNHPLAPTDPSPLGGTKTLHGPTSLPTGDAGTVPDLSVPPEAGEGPPPLPNPVVPPPPRLDPARRPVKPPITRAPINVRPAAEPFPAPAGPPVPAPVGPAPLPTATRGGGSSDAEENPGAHP